MKKKMSCWHHTVQVCLTKKTISESVKWLVINNSAHMGQKKKKKPNTNTAVSWGRNYENTPLVEGEFFASL